MISLDEDLKMNRRELLAAGIGLSSLALICRSSQADAIVDEDKQENLDGPIYCPMFPYMFCGTYTLYYAVQYDPTNGACGANPASMAGPNGLQLGCGTSDCVQTFKADLTKNAVRIDGKHVAHKKIKDHGTGSSPPSVGAISGVHLSKTLLNVKKQNGNHDFWARVYEVTIIKNELDKTELLSMITQAQIDQIASVLQYFPGHQSEGPTGGEAPVDAKVINTQGHTRIVEAVTSGQQYLVIMK